MDFNLLGLNQNQVNSIRSQASLNKFEQGLKSRASALLGQITTNIDKITQFNGAGVCYIDQDDHVYKLREFMPTVRSKPVYIVLRQPPDAIKINDFEAYIRQNNVSPRETRLTSELKGLGYNCGGMVLGWIGVAASGVGSLATFGFSSVVFVISIASALSGIAQCANSAMRVYDEAFDNGALSEKLNTEEWYNNTLTALEAVSLFSAVIGAKGILQIFKIDFSTHGAKYVMEKLKNLTSRKKKELTIQIASFNRPVPNQLYFFNLIGGNFSKLVQTRTIYKKDITSELIDALGSALTVRSSIDGGGILNPNKPSSFTIGILEGLEDA